jgi:hypothetical protein
MDRIHLLTAFALLGLLALAGCGGGGGGGGGGTTPPPPQTITVSVSPAQVSVPLGGTQPFTATVTGTTNTAVNWSVNNVAGGNATVGTISATGLYTAPQNLPSPASVTVTATSQADATRSGSASATITSDLAVSVSPSNPSVELGAVQTFTATVSGSGNPNRNVNWGVSGSSCTGTACGTINSSGAYTAPQIKPSGTVTVTATSQADGSKTGSTSVTVASSFTISVSGPNEVINAAQAQFTADFTVPAGSNPDRGVTWSVAGAGCAGAACGTIDGTGLYTAPSLAPNPAQVTITATSIADTSKTAAKSVTILAQVFVSVSPSPASVELEKTQQFTATVGGTTNQNVRWDVNGIEGGNSTVGTITQAGLYTAPVILPSPASVTVRAVSQEDTSKTASVSVSLFSTISVGVQPSSAVRAPRRRVAYELTVTNTSNTAVTWRVNDIQGGNSTVGVLCVPGSNPCQSLSVTGPGTSVIEYEAPATVPANPLVTVSATSQADPSRAGQAQVTIVANVSVTVSPSSVTLPVSQQQQFSATVTGTSIQQVSWTLSGTGCSDPGDPCGTITTGGLYTAPVTAPAGNVTITATSVDDPNQSGTATVTIATGAFIRLLTPASTLSGGGEVNFVLKVNGFNFVSTTPGPGSTIVFQGTDKTTTCPNQTECTTFLTRDDVASAGNKSVRIKNPDNSLSNQVNLVVVQSATTEDVIELTSGAPTATGRDISVTEPTSTGAGTSQINMNLIGIRDPVSGSCTARVTPIRITRPASGTSNTRICVRVQNNTGAVTLTISGPATNDIVLKDFLPSETAPEFFFVTVEVSSTTQPGARTLFATDANRNRSALTGAIEVK